MGHPQVLLLAGFSLEQELEVEEFVGANYQCEREGGYGDFAYEAYEEGAEALLAHFAKVGAKADSGEG